MKKVILISIIIFFINLTLISHISVFAQVASPTNPKSIKFRSFTPPPSETPTKTPQDSSITGYIEPTNPPSGNNDYAPYFPPNGEAYCGARGLGVYSPHPRYLYTTLCSDGSITPTYDAGYVPSNLVTLADVVGDRYWLRDKSMLINPNIISNLTSLLDYMKNFCVPMVTYAYRNYSLQQLLWNNANCASNPNCGVAPPGASTHQSGTAIDIFCTGLNPDSSVKVFKVPIQSIDNATSFNMIHPIVWDTPHFIGL